jgi:hypothetical protein
MREPAGRGAELHFLRRNCSLDCFAVTVYLECERCGETTIQCLTHRWKLPCRCEREHEIAMAEEAAAQVAKTND